MLPDQRMNAATYSSNPELYLETYQRGFLEFGKEDADRFIAQLSGKKVLDAGCGPGIYLKYFREHELDALGIDLADGFIQLCIQQGLNVRKMDVENPLLYPYQFDGIWANMSLLHVPRARMPRVVETLAKLLKPNGILFVSLKEGTQEGVEVDEDNPSHERWITHYSDSEVKALFAPKFLVLREDRIVLPSGKSRIKFLFRKKV